MVGPCWFGASHFLEMGIACQTSYFFFTGKKNPTMNSSITALVISKLYLNLNFPLFFYDLFLTKVNDACNIAAISFKTSHLHFFLKGNHEHCHQYFPAVNCKFYNSSIRIPHIMNAGWYHALRRINCSL